MRRRDRTALTALLLLSALAVAPTLNIEPSGLGIPDVGRIPVDARFEFAWMRGELRLSGHTVSEQHERDLTDAALASYPGRTVTTKFEPLGFVPGYWEDSTIEILEALAGTSSASAELTLDRLRIHGVVLDNNGWQDRFDALVATLPDSISVSQDAIRLNDTLDAARICRTVLGQFAVGEIRFEMSSAVLRHSALPRLARVSAIIDICPGATAIITGHTDVSGDESWNRHLSLKRANTVADYLANRGIERVRMTTFGAGSSVPVADNSTRYGRGLNRRIDFVFSAPPP